MSWSCFSAAAGAYGLPRQLLSDNGSIFTGRFLGVQVAFERRLADVGVELINSAPAHPQTLGTLERFQRTLKEWLEDEGPARDLAELQALLDRFRAHYNEERPHQGINDQTPGERYAAGWAGKGARAAAVGADQAEPSYPPRSIVRTVASNGVLAYKTSSINIAMRYAGARVAIVEHGELVHVYYGDELIRLRVPDSSRRSQPRERPRERRS